MNAPATPAAVAVPALNRAFVYAGLARFAGERLGAPSAVFESLAGDGELYSLLAQAPGDWLGACRELALRAPQMPGPCGRILHDFRLQLHEWFAFALAGEAEASHLINLALAELQAPADETRPSLHLLAELSQALFALPLPPLSWPNHPLVRAQLARIAGDDALPLASLHVSPRLWALCCGDRQVWRELRLLASDPAIALPAQLEQTLPAIAASLRQGAAPLIVVRGARAAGLALAARLAVGAGLHAVECDAGEWNSRPLLAAACRYAGWLPVLPLALGPGESFSPAATALGVTPIVIVVGVDGTVEVADALEIVIPSLTLDERRRAWQQALGPDTAPALAECAQLDGATIAALAGRIRRAAAGDDAPPDLGHLRQVRLGFAAERLRLLAQPLAREVGADALVLPPATEQQFAQLICRCRRRERLWTGLGPSLATPTAGVRALFAGESGSGKTLAACRLASQLGAPLYRVDLAAVMNKYVGETEKNLGRLLDEAAALDVVLLIDEADALFGRRSEGKETGERYANMMTNFLLTRIESHPGIVVLTTNARNRLDAAFTRRFDAIIEFPLPGVDERYRLWRSHLGARSPSDDDCRLLASYSDLPGGHIRNAVLHAAALSETAPGQPVELVLLVAALASEYHKLGRTPPPQLAQLAARGNGG
ncbi:MAG TPA: ATP-binding protein [Plasticicumulans sp.]|uniref:ATP-binding protein n=1 Tax=Pseudomonadota TaxID=1224 RepID=UPI002CFCD91F|nr:MULTISPECIES: ATP-binding protein [Pseudomonadota]HMW31430.1 ATP-binding protein [Plasticicumulans sp.]HMW81897.1 ATP-binding protein [Accumulibacter sp.]HND40236.1 ATP-binding protein [Accumulibacter sp.]HNE39640.1 ATP-binding protein [Accumulibacter sp.]HNG15455.1 ATP-binding protein [Accumulibacter sp.]